MKTRTTIMISLFIISMLLISCSILSNAGIKVITPSNVIVSENRDVSGFDAIEFSTFGKLNLIQGDQESLNISGPDNLVSEIISSVNNRKLNIRTNDNISVTSLNSENMLTFTLVVKDLTYLAVSGAGDVQIEPLSTPNLELNLSGAGKVNQNQITTEKLNITISGVGGIEVSGLATQSTIEISGAGSVNAADLKIQIADVTISGLGDATLWVTDKLTGNINGAGNVSYYGYPQTDTSSTGLGNYQPLGNK